MQGKQVFRIIIGVLAIMALTLILGSSAGAAEFKTLHKFKKWGVGGRFPQGGRLIFDAAGNLYGTTEYGGERACSGGATTCGTVFMLTPSGDGSWSESVLHSFNGRDGAHPQGGLTFDAAGNLYGTTYDGGGGTCANGCGTVFRLTPNGDGSWVESVLISVDPAPSPGLIFDAAGNLYGGTASGGAYGYGTVFRLAPNGYGSWSWSVLHSFSGSDGRYPVGGLTFDAAGNLYGTTDMGGAFNQGTVFELNPSGGGRSVESVLHSFNGSDGVFPNGGLIFDAAGNLYGTTSNGGAHGYGTVFELTPNTDGSWTESVLHSFRESYAHQPSSRLIFDAAGNLYGTSDLGGGGPCYGGAGCGTVFRLTPNGNGSWTESVLHRFWNRPGAFPFGAGLVLDQTGNLYGTTHGDGKTTFGSVFEITP